MATLAVSSQISTTLNVGDFTELPQKALKPKETSLRSERATSAQNLKLLILKLIPLDIGPVFDAGRV